ncbi:hypothetical protein H9P43_007866 [Blastocladiella emersonii ATCC 22665]|nr:hypothetical protein H9P43_007866 [Blastocladiella emersonii ATCC 22665]
MNHHVVVGRVAGVPVPVYRAGLNKLTTPLGPAREYCPVSLASPTRQFDVCPATWEHAVWYRGKVYQTCSAGHARAFVADPNRFASVAYPDDAPVHIAPELVRQAFPKKFEFLGYCPVRLLRDRGHVDGVMECAVQYGGKLYAMADEAAMHEFMRTPDPFVHQKLLKKLPPRVAPVPLASLPANVFLEKTMQKTITAALDRVGTVRPKFPFMSMTASALLYIALTLKAQNPSFRDHVRRKWQQQLDQASQKAELVQFLAKEMQPTAAPATSGTSKVMTKRDSGSYLEPRKRHPELDNKLATFFEHQRGVGIGRTAV